MVESASPSVTWTCSTIPFALDKQLGPHPVCRQNKSLRDKDAWCKRGLGGSQPSMLQGHIQVVGPTNLATRQASNSINTHLCFAFVVLVLLYSNADRVVQKQSARPNSVYSDISPIIACY